MIVFAATTMATEEKTEPDPDCRQKCEQIIGAFEKEIEIKDLVIKKQDEHIDMLKEQRDEAFEDILQLVGASLIRDDTDLRIIDDVVNHTGSAIDSVNEVGGWSSYDQTEVPLDTDGDGIPDSWENDNGLNYLDPSDNWNDEDGNGYVEIEEYINSLVNHLYPKEPLLNHNRKNVNQSVIIIEIKTNTHHFKDLQKELIIIQLNFSSKKPMKYASFFF